jgi:hypothetical protein
MEAKIEANKNLHFRNMAYFRKPDGGRNKKQIKFTSFIVIGIFRNRPSTLI